MVTAVDAGSENEGGNDDSRRPFLSKGAYVQVAPLTRQIGPNNDGGVGHVLDWHGGTMTFDVQYVLDRRVERHVAMRRVISLNPLAVCARRTRASSLERPSILSPSHQRQPRTPSSISASPSSSASTLSGPHGVAKIIRESCAWSTYDEDGNPLLKYLRDGRKNRVGWMRISEATLRGIELVDGKGKHRKQLLEEENLVVVEVVREIKRLQLMMIEWPKKCNPKADLAHGYGISMSKVKRSVLSFYNNNFSVQRQKRRDAGHTIFNSDAKRQQIFTGYYWYKKAQRKRHREAICEGDLKVGFAQLTPNQLHQCELGASTLHNIVVGIKGEIERVMQHTNGVISWERLAQFIAGGEDKVQPVGATALRRHIMASNGFRYMVTATLPQCNSKRTKAWRYRWSISFHLFWEGAKMVQLKIVRG